MVRRRERCLPLVRNTEEPVTEPKAKKTKVDDQDDSSSSGEGEENDLSIIQTKLLENCLCSLPNSELISPFYLQHSSLDLSTWSPERTLKFLSCVHVICEVLLRQSSDGLVCSRVREVCDDLVRNEHGLIEQVIEWLAHGNQVVGFTACKALSSFLLICKGSVETRFVDRITDCAINTSTPTHMCVSLDVIKRVVDWKDKSPHPLEAPGDRGSVHPSCQATSLIDAESPNPYEVKCMCIKALERKWGSLVRKVDGMITVYSPDYECALITFFNLWELILSIKSNLSVVDTKPFYLNLPSFITVLNTSVPSSVCKHLLNLFNEVLCYGSTLALQDYLPEEPCALAHHVMRSVKDWRLLDVVPYSAEQSGGFGGSNSSSAGGDRTLLQKMALLVLKSVAVTVKETRYESASDSSVGSEADDVDADMAVIERSIREVLRQLDLCVKARLPFHPSMPISEWIVQLFADQDDALIEAMICCLDVSVGLYHRPNMAPNTALSPTCTLVAFLQAVSHDPELLLDLLVSNETCFLLYLLKVLKFIRRNWEEFVADAGRQLEDTMTVLIRLRLAIDRLVQRALFPYSIGPVLRTLEKIEELYEGGNSGT